MSFRGLNCREATNAARVKCLLIGSRRITQQKFVQALMGFNHFFERAVLPSGSRCHRIVARSIWCSAIASRASQIRNDDREAEVSIAAKSANITGSPDHPENISALCGYFLSGRRQEFPCASRFGSIGSPRRSHIRSCLGFLLLLKPSFSTKEDA